MKNIIKNVDNLELELPTVYELEDEDKNFIVNFEYILLNSVLNNEDSYLKLKTLGLKSRDFSDAENRELWEKIESASTEGITTHIVSDQYSEEKKKDAVRLIQKLKKIEYKKEDFDYAYKVIKEDTLRRGLLSISNVTRLSAVDKKKDIKESYVDVMSRLLELDQVDDQIQEFDSSKSLTALSNRMREGLKGKTTRGVSSGIKTLDEKIGCFYYGLTNIVAARPGHGKTTFMLNTFLNNIIDGKNPLFISLEMTQEEVMEKLLSTYSKIPVEKISKPRLLKPKETEILKEKMRELAKMEFHIVDALSLNVMELGSLLRRYIRKESEICYIDYAQLLKTRKDNSCIKTEDFREVFKDLRETIRSVNREGKMAVVLAVQAGRSAEDKRSINDRIPLMSDLEYCSSLEQDAGLVIGLMNREKYEFDQCEYKDTLFVGVSKNRFGQTSRFMLNFFGDIQYITDYSTSTTDRWKTEVENSNRANQEKNNN